MAYLVTWGGWGQASQKLLPCVPRKNFFAPIGYMPLFFASIDTYIMFNTGAIATAGSAKCGRRVGCARIACGGRHAHAWGLTRPPNSTTAWYPERWYWGHVHRVSAPGEPLGWAGVSRRLKISPAPAAPDGRMPPCRGGDGTPGYD
jgi:hypothetical protein